MNSFEPDWSKVILSCLNGSVMKTSFALLFFLKKPKVYKGGNVPIYFRITVDGVEREISTQLDADPLKWSNEAHRLIGKSEATKSVNEYLDVLQAKAINARTKLAALDKPITADNIKALVQNKPLDAVRTIMSVFKDHNDKMRELIGKEYSEGIMERYDISYRHTISFMQQTYGISDMPIDKLDFGFITDYEHWLKSVRNCQHNTAMKYLSYFKKIVRICIKKNGSTVIHLLTLK